MLFAANHFLPRHEWQPGILTSIFPIATVFNPGIDAIHERIRYSPGELGRAANGHTKEPRKSCAHGIARSLGRGPAQDGLVPNRWQSVDFKMRIVAKKWFAGSGFCARHD